MSTQMGHEERVIVVGAGLSGVATALGAAVLGRRVTVFEAADLVGGAAAYSGGQVWVGANHVAAGEGVDDDLERTERYVRGIAGAHPELLDEQAMRRWVQTAPVAVKHWEDLGAVRWTLIRGLADYHTDAGGALPSGRYLTGEPVDAVALGSWGDRLRVSPYFRTGTTYADMFLEGRRQTTQARQPEADKLTLGTGLVAGFLARALQENDAIQFQLATPVQALLRDDDGRVTGVRAAGPDGPVEEHGPVVLATSTYDWDPALVEEFLGLTADDFGSMAPDSIRGDGIRLARSVDGAIVKIPATCVPMVPGWRSVTGTGFVNGPEYAMPHAMIVDQQGRRFCNDSYWVDMVPKALDPADPHVPFFLIWDEQHHRKYGLGETAPGGVYPAGLVTSAPTLGKLGELLGIGATQLEATAATFSEHAARGEDPEFGRGTVEFVNRFSGDPSHTPSPVLGPITEPPFYGLRLIFLGTAIGSSGVRIDGDGHVLDNAGSPIPGLYAVGSCAATTTFGSGYNSGMALSRGLTLAYLVAQELAGPRP
jgi:3-oxosteroid 1-dehydrogenase